MGELIYGKGGWGARSSHPALLGGRQVRQQPRLPACLRKRRPGLSHEPGQAGGGAGSQSAEGESGDLRGSLAGGREAAPGCRVRSTSPFPGACTPPLPGPTGWRDVSPAVCPLSPHPTKGSGPWLVPLVPVKSEFPARTSLQGASGQGRAGAREETPARDCGREPCPRPPLHPAPTSLQLFKASGGRGKLLQMCGFSFFSTGTGSALSVW